MKTSNMAKAKPMNERIKVCHFITKMVYGGASIGTLRLAQDMDPSVIHSTIVCGRQSRDEGNLLEDIEKKSFDTVVIPEIVREINPIKDITALIKAVRFMKSERFDIIHAHGSRAGVISRLAAAVCRVPVVLYTVHGWSLKAGLSLTSLFMWVERILALITSKILFQTKADWSEGIQHRIGKLEQYVLIGNGVALEDFFAADRKAVLILASVRTSSEWRLTDSPRWDNLKRLASGRWPSDGLLIGRGRHFSCDDDGQRKRRQRSGR